MWLRHSETQWWGVALAIKEVGVALAIKKVGVEGRPVSYLFRSLNRFVTSDDVATLKRTRCEIYTKEFNKFTNVPTISALICLGVMNHPGIQKAAFHLQITVRLSNNHRSSREDHEELAEAVGGGGGGDINRNAWGGYTAAWAGPWSIVIWRCISIPVRCRRRTNPSRFASNARPSTEIYRGGKCSRGVRMDNAGTDWGG